MDEAFRMDDITGYDVASDIASDLVSVPIWDMIQVILTTLPENGPRMTMS